MSGLTKFFYHDMKGAPQLKSEWGSLLNVIRGVAIDGFNPQNALTVSIVDGMATITFDELVPHGFIQHQVISLSGAIESEFNGDYRITSVNDNIITFNTSFVDGVTGDVTIKTSGMGWTENYTGENKAVFTAKDTVKNPFYLRVDDSCPVGYDTTWGKFARVTISNGINDIDNYDGFDKAPTSPQYLNTNENGNGVSGETGIFGWAKWYHGVETNQYLRENIVPNVSSPLKWEIVGDDSSIYLLIQITGTYSGKANYAFTHIDSVSSIDNTNCFLAATDGLRGANQNGEYFTTGSASANCKWSSLDYSGKYVLREIKNLSIGNHVNVGLLGLNIGNNQQVSGRSTDINSTNGYDNSILMSSVYLKNENYSVRGKLPVIKWVHNKWTMARFFIKNGNTIDLILGCNYASEGNTSYFIFRLKDE